MSANSLRDWVNRSKPGPFEQRNHERVGLSQDEELKRLRRENRILREEREILKIPKAHLASFKKFFTWLEETKRASPETVSEVLGKLRTDRDKFLKAAEQGSWQRR